MANKRKQFPGQHEGEEVNLVFHQHPIVMRYSLIIGMVVLVVFAIPLSLFPTSTWPWWGLLIGFGLMLIILGYRWIGWYYSIFIVTGERLIQIKQKGFFDRRVVDIGHNKIQSVNYQVKGVMATMMHFGTITVQTYVGDLVLQYIHHPEDVQQLLVKSIREVKPVDVSEMGAGAAEGG